jgi:hypothetical protein
MVLLASDCDDSGSCLVEELFDGVGVERADVLVDDVAVAVGW